MSFIMSMIGWFFAYFSSHFFIVISFRIFACHSSIKSHHQFLIFFSIMITSTILPHHISNPGCFSYSQMFYMFVNLLIPSFYLSDDR